MRIIEVRIKLMEDGSDDDDRLLAFASITFNFGFALHDLKVIAGKKGTFVAMPSRKLTDHCPRCGRKNHLQARFCNYCGRRLDGDRAVRDVEGRAELHADIAHPINKRCRVLIEAAVITAYEEELRRSRLPGYVCTYDRDWSDNGTRRCYQGNGTHG